MSETGRLHRRSRASMRSLHAEMRALESSGHTRKHIALALNATPAQVTRGLGPRRRWRDRRVPREALRQKLSLAADDAE